MRIIILLAAIAAASISCSRQESISAITGRVFELASIQYTAMDACLDEGRCPKCTDEEGNLETSDIGWWCSGFYPGSLWYIYEYTADEAIRELADRHTIRLEPLRRQHTDHDIGFQINCSYGNALRVTGDEKYRQQIIDCAHRLCWRFNPEAGVIRSWDFLRNDWRYPVIIDNMMNLELLTNAHRMCGVDSLKAIAVQHAQTTLKNHFREDWTSWHLLDYDVSNGQVRYRETVQGYAHESAWARGQAWALYGYTMMYRETSLPEFLEAAENIGRMLMERLPEDGIPYWDFDDPDIPEALRDASAGAIMASAFVELSTLTEDRSLSRDFLATARKQIRTLASDEYLAEPGTNGCFILKHSTGNIPGGTEIDVPLTYADYYFLEALVRHSKLI